MIEPSTHQRSELETLADLIRLDYDATLRAMHSFVQTAGQIRGIGVAAWGVVLGLAVRDTSWELSVLAASLIAMFAYADAYHAALYRRAFSRAVRLETLLDDYLNCLGIDAGDEEAEIRLLSKLETHRFGMNRSLGKLTVGSLLNARPLAIFRFLYPGVLGVSLALVLIYAF
jgi:hypothetical protein